jgi:hypothetical protein
MVLSYGGIVIELIVVHLCSVSIPEQNIHTIVTLPPEPIGVSSYER